MIKAAHFSAVLLVMVSMFTTTLGCGNHRRKNRGPSYPVGNLWVYCPPEFTQEQITLILESVEIHLDHFEQDWEHPTRPCPVYVLDTDFVPCDQVNAIGCFSTPPDAITVIAGEHLQVPALYHELWHLNMGDFEHASNQWVLINQTMSIINFEIINQRNLLPVPASEN